MSEASGVDTATPNDVAEGQGQFLTTKSAAATDDLELSQQQAESQGQSSTQQTEQNKGQPSTTAASIGTGTDDLDLSEQSETQVQGQEAWNLDSYLQSQGEDKNPFCGLSDEHLNQLEDVLSSDAVKSLLQQAEFQNLESSLMTGMEGPSTSQGFSIDQATAHQIIQDGVREHELAVMAAAFNDHAYAMPLVRQAQQSLNTSIELVDAIDTPSPSYEPIESPSSSFKPPATPTSSKGKKEEDKSPHEPIRRSTRISDAEQREMAEKILQENRQKAREALLNQEEKEEEKEEPKKGKRGRKPKTENDAGNPLNTKWNKKNRRTRSAKNGEEEAEESVEEGGATEEDTPKPAAGRGKKATEGTETPPPMKRVSRGKWKNPLFKDRPQSEGSASPKNPASPASGKGNNSPALTRNALKKDEPESENKPTPKQGRGRKKKQEVEETEDIEEEADEKKTADAKTALTKKSADDKNGDTGVESIPYTEFITQLETKPKGQKGAGKKGQVNQPGKKGLQKVGTVQTKKGKVKVKDQKESGSQSSEEDIPLGQLQQRSKPKKVKPKLKATLTDQPAVTEEDEEEDVPLKTLSKLTKSPSKLKKLKAAISSKRTVKMLHKKPGVAGKSKFLKNLKPPSQIKIIQEKKRKMAEKKRLAMEQKLAEEEAKKEPPPETPKTPTAVDKNAAKRKARKSETEVFIDPTMTDLFKPDGMIVHEHEKEAPAPEIKFDSKGHRIPDSEVKAERKDSDSKQTPSIKNEKQDVSKSSGDKAEVKKTDVKVEKSNQVKVEKSNQVKVEKSNQVKVEKSNQVKVEKSNQVKVEKSEVKKSDPTKTEKSEMKKSDHSKGEQSVLKRSDSGLKSEMKKERRESSADKHKISTDGHHAKHRHASDEKRKHSTEERHRHSTEDRKKAEKGSVGEMSEMNEKDRKPSKASNPDEAPGEKPTEEDSESEGGLSFEDDENDEDWLAPDTVYCLCRKPHSNRFMIECDCCEKWFHGSCVGVTETMGKEFEALDMNFVCPVCTESGKEPKAKPTLVKTFHSPVKVFSAESKVTSTTLTGDTPKSKHRHHSKSDADNSSSKSSDKSTSSKQHHRHHHHKDSKHRDKSREHSREHSRDKDRKDHKERRHSKDHKRSKHHKHEKESDKKSSEKKDEGPDPVRLNVRKHLRDALSNRAEHADDVLLSSSEIKALSMSIEEEMFNYFKDVGHKYRNKYRSLIFNIKDPKNNGLFRKILNGKIRASKLVQMSSTELASKELAEWRKMETKHTLKLIEETEKKAATESFHIRKKTHKGEIEIDEDMSNLRDEAEKPAPSKPKIEPKADLLSELIIDTTDKHRLHLFDSNCKICTGKQAPPSQESTPKKVTIAHSVDKEQMEEATKDTTVSIKKAEQVVKEALANVKKVKVELPDSPVTVRSPDSALQSGLEESRAKFKPSGPFLWKGFIHMQEFNKFFTSAYRVSGPTDGLSFADTIQICGRIIPEQIWDYLSKIKQAGTRDVCVIRFIPAGDEEKISYVNLYSYLNSRARCGVVGNIPKQVKDFYIIPLASHSRIPQTLLPFDGPGLEENRPHMLIGVLVRQKSKPPKSPLVKEASKSKHSSSSHSSGSSSKKPRLSVDSPSSSHKEKKTSMYVPKVVTPSSNSSSEPGTPAGYKEIQDPIIKAYSTEEVVAIETEESSANDTEAYSPGRVEEEEVPYDPEFEENNSGNTASGPSSAMARAMELTLATIGEPLVSSKAPSDAPKTKVTISLVSSVSQTKSTPSQPSTSKKEMKSCLKNPISSSGSEDVIPLPPETPSASSAASTSDHHHHQQHHSKPGINIEKLVQQIANSTNRSEITALMVTALAASKDATDQQKVLADLTRKVEEQKKLLAKKKAEIERVRASTLALTATSASTSTATQPAVTVVTESPEKMKTSSIQKTPPKVDYVVAVKHAKHDAKELSPKKVDSKPEEKVKDPKETVSSTVTPIITTKGLDSVQISKALDALKTTKMLDNLVSVFRSTQSKTPVTTSSLTPLPTEMEVEEKAESISVSAMKPHEMPLALQALMKDVMGHGSESGIKSKKIQKEEKKPEEPKSDLEEDKDSLAIFKGVNKREKNVIPGLDDLPIASVMIQEQPVVESSAASDGESSTSDTQTSTEEVKLDKDYRSKKKSNVVDISLDKDDRKAHSLDKDDRKVHSLDKDERIVRGMLPRYIPTQPKKDWTVPTTTAEQAATWPATTDVDHRKFPSSVTVNVSTPQPLSTGPPGAKEGKFRPVGVPQTEEVKEDVDHRKLDGPMRPIGATSDPFGFGTQDVDMRRPPTGQAPLLPPPIPPASNAGSRPLLSTPLVFKGNQPPFRPSFPSGDQRFRAPASDIAMKRGPPFQPTLSEGEPSDKRPRFPGTGPGFRQPLMRPPAPPGTEPVTLMPPGMPPLPSEPLLPPPLPPPPLPTETVQDKDLRGGGGGDPSGFGNSNRQSSPRLEDRDRDRFSHHHRQHDRYHNRDNRDKDYRSRNRNRRR